MERPDDYQPKTAVIAQTLTSEQAEEMLRLESIGKIPKLGKIEQAIYTFAFMVVVVASYLFN